MKKWLIGVMAILMAVSLAACMPTIEKQKKETTAVIAAKPQKDTVLPSTGGASDKVPDPNAISVAMISVYHGGRESLVQDMDSLDTGGLDAQLLVNKLIEYGVLTGGTEVLSFDVRGKDGNAVRTLDLNQTGNAEGCSDKMSLTGTGNTFTENFELSKPELKVNGADYEDDDIKQGDGDYPTYNADYESIGQISERGGCP